MHLDLADLITADHHAIEELLGALETPDRHDRFQLLHRLIDELSAHITAKEQILCPALRDIVPGGAAMANEAQKQHDAMRKALVKLADGRPGDADFESTLRALATEVRDQVPEEENAVVPALRAVIGEDKMRELGDIYDGVKQTTPSGLAEPSTGSGPKLHLT